MRFEDIHLVLGTEKKSATVLISPSEKTGLLSVFGALAVQLLRLRYSLKDDFRKNLN